MYAAHNAIQKGVDQAVLLAVTQMLDAVSGTGSGLAAAQPRVAADGAARTSSKPSGGSGSSDGGKKRQRAPVQWKGPRHRAGVYAARLLGKKNPDKAKIEE